jgi:hypothetical protein
MHSLMKPLVDSGWSGDMTFLPPKMQAFIFKNRVEHQLASASFG